MTSEILNNIKMAKVRIDNAPPNGSKAKLVDALKNIMVNGYDDIVEALEFYEVLDKENKDLKEQIENLQSELADADEEYNALKKKLNAPGDQTGALGDES